MKHHPAGAGRDGNPLGRLEIAARVTRLTGLSSLLASRAARIVVSAHSGRSVHPPYTTDIGGYSGLGSAQTQPSESVAKNLQISVGASKPDNLSKRPATLRCARSGGPGPSAAGRAPATGGSQTRGGAVSVRWAVEAVCCGAVGCHRSDGLLRVETSAGPRVLCPAHLRRWGQ